ncbi:hypothetical protein [Lysobacter sp. N42]|jgi:hypothetical protein|uniref:hypothetical protein n=1 Tax=Lysobacter sp. N42 TaxID=2545719 RepID=UPI001043CFA3|nr:hypothetical protein [Lysobacter sp. N42]TCZ82416.1 hypothetical protein EYQ95_23065 [Lysobacter sp. N42]
MSRLARLLALTATLVLAACASGGGSQTDALDRAQYAWSAAVRWNDFEGAVNLIDPDRRAELAPTGLQMERYRQVQMSAYRDVGSSRDLDAGTAARDIEIGVINRHTQAERRLRHRETWRWDPEARTWWNTSGLPDLWEGQ